MTDVEETSPEPMPELETTFLGRKIWVRMPSPEQLLVWRRTLTRLQSPDVQGWNAEQVMIALERTRRIVDSILVHDTDVVWLDDEFLSGTLTLQGLMPLIPQVVDAFAEAAKAEGNRETRRAKPAKKAARKRVSKP